jgi:predicted phosphodiesterase
MKGEGIPILAVSDTHFGRGVPGRLSCRSGDFVKFLDWVLLDRTVLLADGTERKLSFPRKVVLLGDILELWAPLKDSLVFKTAYAPLAKLQEVGAKGSDLIYVVGNHDSTLSDYQDQYGVTDLDGSIRPIPHVPSLQVIKDAYLSGRYVFVHGHQLVRAFRWLSPFCNILGFIQRLVAAFGETLKRAIVGCFLLALVTWYFLRTDPVLVALVAFGILTGFIVIRQVGYPTWTFLKGFWKMLSKTAEMLEAWLYGKTRPNPQYMEFSDIVREGSLQQWWDEWWNEYKSKFPHSTPEEPEVIVFGHTHKYGGPIKIGKIKADQPKVDDKLKEKTMVNTGCWIKEGEEDCASFLFITEKDEMLLCGYYADVDVAAELPAEIYPERERPRQMDYSIVGLRSPASHS